MDDTEKNALLARIAALETEVAPMRAQSKKPAGLDPKTVTAAFHRDPIAALAKFGIPQEYVTQVLVAAALEAAGQPVPEQLRAARASGSTLAATSDLRDEVSALRQRMETEATERKRQTTRESTKTLVADKTKYPRLAAAFVADPSLFERDFDDHKGDATELVDKLEKRLAATAKALGMPDPQSASDASADKTSANPTSKQGTAQVSGSRAGDPPPITTSKSSKGFTDEDRQALRDEIVRNAERGVYDAPTHPYRPQ